MENTAETLCNELKKKPLDWLSRGAVLLNVDTKILEINFLLQNLKRRLMVDPQQT